MTGTGNSFRVAAWAVDALRDEDINASLIQIDKNRRPRREAGRELRLLGVVFPTHGFTAPWSVIKFAFRLPRRRRTPAFCIATRAGAKFGRVFTPGLAGTACFIIAFVLALKGYRVRGGRTLRNYTRRTEKAASFLEPQM